MYSDIDDEEYSQTLSLYRDLLGAKNSTKVDSDNENKKGYHGSEYSYSSFLTENSRNSVYTKQISKIDLRDDTNSSDQTILLQKEIKMKKDVISEVFQFIKLEYASLVFVVHNETENKFSVFQHELNTQCILKEKIKVYPPNVTKNGDVLTVYMVCFITNSFRIKQNIYDVVKFQCLTHFRVPLCSAVELNCNNFGGHTKQTIDLLTGTNDVSTYHIRCKYKRNNISSRVLKKNLWKLYFLQINIISSSLLFLDDLKEILLNLEKETIHDKQRALLTNHREKLYEDIEKGQQEQLHLYQQIIQCKVRLKEKKEELLFAERNIEMFDQEWDQNN